MRRFKTWLFRVRLSRFRMILGLGGIPSPLQRDRQEGDLADAYRRLALLETRASLIGLSVTDHDAPR